MQRLHLFLLSFFMLLSSVSHSEIRTSLVAQGLSFISTDYENTASKNFFFMGASLRSDQKSADAFKINLTGMYGVGNSVLSYLNMREIYFTYRIDESSVIDLGRKMHNWSSLDTVWNMGVYQPQFNWNPLASENQGLTGLFYNKKENGYSFTLFVSPLYIPNQGASYEIKDGQFESVNPWVQNPPQNLKFQNQLLPIDYQINKPEVSSVIFQTSYGAHLALGESTGYFGQVGAIYKPANTLALAYKGVLVTTRVRVDVTPQVYFENNYSADMGYRADWGVAQFSLLYSKPQNPSFDSSYNAPEFEQSLSWGPQFLYRFKPVDLFFAYLDTSGGDVKEVGPDASPDRKPISQRLLFRQAWLAQATYSSIFWDYMKWDSSLQYKASSKDAFRQIRFKNTFNIRGPWAFWLDCILIDTDSSVQTNMESYKNLDQVWLGASYDL